jgi:hypothetical protein
MLALFIPPDNFKYSVSVISDGQEEVKVVERPKLLATAAESLPTVIDADGEGLKKADRRTEIQVYESTDGTGRLFEMGVPVQPIDAPYSVSVEQKVPLDPNRNMVRPAFLERIYAIVLNSVHEQMNGEAMAETWVSKAVQNNLSNEEARKSVKEKKFGRTLLRSSDPWANAEAIEHGFNVIDSRLVPPKERENLQALGLRPAGQVFSRKSAPGTDIPRSEWTEGMLAAESLAHWIGRIWGIEPIVSFFTSKATCAAQYCPAEHSLEYNLSRCGGKSFFALPLSWEVLRLTLHEIAHEKGDWHDAAYRQGMEELAAKLMLRVLEQPAEFREIVH